MTALAFDKKHLSACPVEVFEAQTEDRAAAQTAERHCFDHRPITPTSTRPDQGINLGWLSDSRQRSRRADQRHTALATVA